MAAREHGAKWATSGEWLDVTTSVSWWPHAIADRLENFTGRTVRSVHPFEIEVLHNLVEASTGLFRYP